MSARAVVPKIRACPPPSAISPTTLSRNNRHQAIPTLALAVTAEPGAARRVSALNQCPPAPTPSTCRFTTATTVIITSQRCKTGRTQIQYAHTATHFIRIQRISNSVVATCCHHNASTRKRDAARSVGLSHRTQMSRDTARCLDGHLTFHEPSVYRYVTPYSLEVRYLTPTSSDLCPVNAGSWCVRNAGT
jgi:hypothetical protein